MKTKMIVHADGVEKLSIPNRGFAPVLLMEFLASRPWATSIAVESRDEEFLIIFNQYNRVELCRLASAYINANL